jgi:DNA-binding winged helix-turn-helix (wHTH) protein/Tol biopolymer transport system component
MASYRFLNFELSEEDFFLAREGQRMALEPKALRVLIVLVSRPGRLVDKRELLETVWPNTFVEENTLTRTIAILRRELGDSSRTPKIIETVPTRGYRFVAAVETVAEPKPDQGETQSLQGGVIAASAARPGQSRRWTNSPFLLAGLCVLAIGIAGAAFLLRRAHRHEAPGHQVVERRVTSNSPEAAILFAALSPDGKYLAYSDPTGLYLRVIATGETRRWDVPKGFVAHPNSWYPDGTHLVVTRFDGMPPKTGIWKLSMLGGAPQKIIDNAVAGMVSPDGERIAYLSFCFPMWGQELWVMNGDGSNPHKVTQATAEGRIIFPPAWSPNGRRIAYLEHELAGEAVAQFSSIWTRNPDGSDPQQVVESSWLGTGIAWAADGRLIFASHAGAGEARNREGIRSIRLDESTGKAVGKPQFVTDGEGSIDRMSVSSNGKRLILCRMNSDIHTFISEFDDSTGEWKTPRRLTLDANTSLAYTWLADSKTVVFASNRNGKWTLFKQAIDETTAEVLAEGNHVYLPRLSADGTHVLYVARNSEDGSKPMSLMRVPVAGGPPQQVLEAMHLGNFQCARLPSTLCVFHKEEGKDWAFVSFDPLHGAGKELLRTELHGNWGVSPDGKTLSIMPGERTIKYYSLENGTARASRTTVLKDWWFENGDWSADGKSLLIPSATAEGQPVIIELSESGKVSVALKGTPGMGFDFMVPAPDGKHAIVGEVIQGDSNAWMIEKF